MNHLDGDTRNLEPPASAGSEGAYIAHLWEHSHLCLALFGVQFLTPEGQRRGVEGTSAFSSKRATAGCSRMGA